MNLCCNLQIVAACIFVVGAFAHGTESEQEAHFEKHVRPTLVAQCYACHSGTKTSGGLSLETAAGLRRGGDTGPAIIPGKPEQSLLIQAVRHRGLKMPPDDANGKQRRLTKEEIQHLSHWISTGAFDPRQGVVSIGGMTRQQATHWWSFQPLPKRSEPLSAAAIDRLIAEKWDAEDLAPAAPATRRELLRRATYDLIGLPPTPEETTAFQTDASPNAFGKVMERLLKSPHYGERWGRHWLDVVRYADTAGENTDRPLPHAWRYRNWVIQSLNQDLPFTEFVQRQIAGDLLQADASSDAYRDGIIATGYLAIARRFGHDIDKDIHLMHEDVIDNLGKAMLGLSLGCARCHDHKYDPITASDYYALYGVFASTKFSFPGCEPKGQPRDLIPLLSPGDVARIRDQHAAAMAEFQKLPNKAAKTLELKKLASKTTRLLRRRAVGEGKSEPMFPDGKPMAIELRQDEVIQLSVSPNGNYGADSTRIAWKIKAVGQPAAWDLNEVIPIVLREKSAMAKVRGATWCFLETTNGPVFHSRRRDSIDDQPSLQGWSAPDENPALFVNRSDHAVDVWTRLPPQTVFVHPGNGNRPAAIAWICPRDGQYELTGEVADAHPAPGLDGVSFQVEHFQSPEFGKGLLQLATMSSRQAPVMPAIPVAYGAVDRPRASNAALHMRGDPEQLGDVIPRRWLGVFGGELFDTSESGRRELATRVAEHPLAARVIVNRIWQWHFGRGLVATPNDFGARGEAPTHAKLLDQLAAQFVADGYRMKPLHKLIMSTQAYQRSSRAEPSQRERDPSNQWLARFQRRRLTAEELRDSLLHAAGALDLTPGQAHPFPLESSWKFTQHAPFHAAYETNRRSVYLMVQRQRRHPFLSLFDGADPNASTGARNTTTVATQALFFLNNPLFHQQSIGMANRLMRVSASDRIDLAHQILYQRDAHRQEHVRGEQFTRDYPGDERARWAAYCRVLMSANESLYID